MSSLSQRRLAAVLASEAVTIGTGDRLRMEAWLGILSGYKSAFAGQIESARGNVIGRSHTAILAEFATIVHAVNCALKFQHSVSARNSGLPPENRVYFRMGLHVGEIILGDNVLTGIGVQTALQLGAASQPGGILISGQAYDLIANIRNEFEPAPSLIFPDGRPELRVYGRAPDEEIYSNEDPSEDGAAPEAGDITVLDLSQRFTSNKEVSTVTSIQPMAAPVAVPNTAATAGIGGAAPELTILRIEELLQQASANARNANYYQALQCYDEVRQLAEQLGPLAPERQTFYLNLLRENTVALENAFAFMGDAVVEVPGGPFVVRLASSLDIGRGRQGAEVGCSLVSRIGGQTRISVEGDQFHVIDLGSKNGTFIDGRWLEPQETYGLAVAQTSMTIRLGGSRSTGTPGPVCVNLTQIHSDQPTLLVRISPSEDSDQAKLSSAWPSLAEDCRLTYVFSNGPVLIGNRGDCAIRLRSGVPDPLAKIEFDHHYQIAPYGDRPLMINHIAFARPVVLSNRSNVEVAGLQFEIHARNLETLTD